MSNDSPFFSGRYSAWLRKQAGIEEYVDLSMTLCSTRFHSAVMMDENRATDGMNLRNVYMDDTGGRLATDIRGCSVMEFLVAMAFRLEDTYSSYPASGAMNMFLNNMDLLKCTDEWYLNQRDPDSYVLYRCDVMMDREFNPNGSGGGLFVTHYDTIRQKEWWFQMQSWLNEQFIPDM